MVAAWMTPDGFEADEFERAAADIGEDAVGAGDAALQPGGGEGGFLLAGEDADAGAGHALLEGGDEFGAVGGVADGGGGEDLEGGGAHGPGDDVVADHDLERLGDAGLVEAAGGLQAAAEAQDGFFIEDRHRVTAETFVDDQADGVRTEVDHGAARGAVAVGGESRGGGLIHRQSSSVRWRRGPRGGVRG